MSGTSSSIPILDRSLPPEHTLRVADKDLIVSANIMDLDNGMPCYLLAGSSSGLFRLDVVFQAGTWYELQPLTAWCTNRMLREGTMLHDSIYIAETFDYYGAYLEDRAEHDRAIISMYCPTRFAEQVLPLLTEILSQPIIPEPILERELLNQRQKFLINQERVGYVARKHFAANVFGKEHPYGRLIQASDFEAVDRNSLLDHYQRHYQTSGAYVIVSGDADDRLINQVNQTLGQWKPAPIQAGEIVSHQIIKTTEPTVIIHKKEALQSAIRIGCRLFSRDHPDFVAAQFTITLLGGYFGSRLMKNIREAKGYTYGIGAFLQTMERDGLFVISTEVGKEYVNQAVDEIFGELDRLRKEPVSQDEIDLVRNYFLGLMMRTMDGVFARADRYKVLKDYGLGKDYYVRYKEQIESITPEIVSSIAVNYFAPSGMIRVIAG